ncbi:MAG: TonB-dependent receptor [Proteobacteria bacterium]|nr:TonB-dependent receptor [Pseudomonadota bacterium]
MTTGIKAALLAGAGWMVLAGAAAAQGAPATPPTTPEEAAQQNEPLSPQDANDPITEATQDSATEGGNDATEVGEVIVTARRREESLQDVPIAVSAFSAERLERQGAQDITALQQITPNTTVQIARGSNTTLISFIRGVGQQDPLPGFEPGVGLYIDDVYVARPQGAVLEIYDVQRIEVLRGPQGTLYGRNTIGGAIKYVTDKIGDEPEFMARGRLGSYNQRDLIVAAKTPLGGGLAVGGALASLNRDGYGKNLTTGAEHYNRDALAGRLSAEYAPTEDLFFRLAYERVEDDSNARHGHREVVVFVAPGVVRPGTEIIPGRYDTRAGLGDANSVMTEGLSLLAQYSVNEAVTLKSISAYRSGETVTNIDFDNTREPLLDVPATYYDAQFTQELQILYEGQRLQGVLGVYYLDGEANNSFDTIVGLANLTIGSINNLTTRSVAVFGDFSFDVTEQFAVSVGGRFTRDEKTGRIFRANFQGAPAGSPLIGPDRRSPILGGRARAPTLVRTDYTKEREDEQFTPRVSASYEFSPDLTAYASYSRGFKSGGFDPRGDFILTPETIQGFAPETVDAFEVGLKGALLDRRLTYAIAAFNNAYEDQQVTSQIPTSPPAAPGIASFVTNAGSSTIRGLELEANWRPVESLTITGAFGYIDAEFQEFIRADPVTRRPTNFAGQVDFQNTPEYSANLSATFRPPLPADLGVIAVTPSVSYRSSYQQFELPNPVLDQGGYTLVDLTASYTTPSGRYRLAFEGRNLGDEEYRVGGYPFAGALFGDSVIGFYGPPATYTAVLEVRF